MANKATTDELPTLPEILNAAHYKKYEHTLKMMQQVENAGHGNSVERELLNLILNYDRNAIDLRARLWDMKFGDYHEMYSYSGIFDCSASKTCGVNE